MEHRGVWAAAALVLLASRLTAGYIPGIAVSFAEGEPLSVYANKLQSLKSKLPHQYHYAYPYCRPLSTLRQQNSKKLTLGQLLLGERHELTNFEMSMLVNENCKFLCKGEIGRNMTGPLQKLNSDLVLKLMQWLIEDQYVVRLNLDNLPVVMRSGEENEGPPVYSVGYPFGFKERDQFFVNNHFKFTIRYHRGKALKGTDQPGYRIVSFEVQPYSLANNLERKCALEEDAMEFQQLYTDPIAFTYDVNFVESEQSWATRWDPFLEAKPMDVQIQWFSISNSVVLTLFLAMVVGVILLKTVHNDFARYNGLENEEEIADEFGWKLVHADVFRPPQHPEILAVLCGIGAQLLATLFVTLSVALFGFVSPAYRGSLLTYLIAFWNLLSSVSGYVSATMYTSFGGKNRKMVWMGAAFLFTAPVFGIFLLLNIMLSLQKSSGAVPFRTLLTIITMWFGMSVPLVLVGSHLGFRKRVREWPCRVNSIPREIPDSLSTRFSKYHCLLCGLVPFGVVYTQLIFALRSIWQNMPYYMFGALFVIFILVLIASAEVSVAFTYLKLAAEDHRWWWYTYRNMSFAGVYVFLCSCGYLLTQTDIDWRNHPATSVLMVSYTAIVSAAFGLIMGYTGLVASINFVRTMYASIRID